MQEKCVCVTGASGFIGSHVVADLLYSGFRVKVLAKTLPAEPLRDQNIEYFEYEEMDLALNNADIVLHLAAKNNDSAGASDEFLEVNFGLTKKLALAAESCGVGKFIFVSTTKALRPKDDDWYSLSKFKAEAWLEKEFHGNMRTCILRLPPVHGSGAKNKLSKLEKLPRLMSGFILHQIRAMTPIVSVEEVSSQTLGLLDKDEMPSEIMISSPLSRISIYWLFNFLTNASFVLLCFAILPLLIVVALMVFLTSKGPALFIQERVGKHQMPYKCIKFRTMAFGTKQQGTHLVKQSSVTKIGGFLRKTKLDELPQAINILTGRMSLIGPRPCLPTQNDVIREREKLGVYCLTPGISGLAQVNDIDMSTPRELAVFDQRYKASRSIIMDCKVVVQTATGSGQGDLVKTVGIS